MYRLSQTFKIVLAFLFAVLSTNLLPVYASAYSAPDPVTPTQKVNICHSAGQSGTYTTNEIDTSAVDELNNPDNKNGHGTHENDIIPPFTSSPDGVVYPGKNWDKTGQAIYANDCVVPTQPPVDYCNPAPAVGSVANWVPKDVNCVEFTVETSCGMVTPTITNLTPFTTWDVSWSEGTPDWNTNTALPATFPEDYNGGSVDVYYWLTGPEKDYILDRGIYNYWEQSAGKVTVDTDCQTPVTLVPCETFPQIHATNLAPNGWSESDPSKVAYVDGGIKLSVDGNWDETTITRTISGELRDLGTGVNFAPNQDYLGLHVETSAGTLVYEKYYENQNAANTGKWWSKSDFGVASGMGYATFDTLENIVAANPDVTLISLSVLYTSPIAASSTVTSVKIGCKEYTFDYERLAQPCSVSNNTYRDVWMYDGYTYPEADDYNNGATINNATFEFKDDGLHISTPASPDYVFGLIDGGNTALADVDTMSYMTYRKEISAGYVQTLPAYILLVDTNGSDAGGLKYFFYEPYNNGAVTENSWQTWDAIKNGDAKWWMSGTGQALQTWDYFVSQYPDAVVLAYGFNQGTSNAETYAIVQDLVFDCATTHFSSPQVLGEETTDEPTPVTPTVQNVLAANNTLPAQLPATGDQSDSAMLFGIVMAALTYFLVLRRQESYEI